MTTWAPVAPDQKTDPPVKVLRAPSATGTSSVTGKPRTAGPPKASYRLDSADDEVHVGAAGPQQGAVLERHPRATGDRNLVGDRESERGWTAETLVSLQDAADHRVRPGGRRPEDLPALEIRSGTARDPDLIRGRESEHGGPPVGEVAREVSAPNPVRARFRGPVDVASSYGRIRPVPTRTSGPVGEPSVPPMVSLYRSIAPENVAVNATSWSGIVKEWLRAPPLDQPLKVRSSTAVGTDTELFDPTATLSVLVA